MLPAPARGSSQIPIGGELRFVFPNSCVFPYPEEKALVHNQKATGLRRG